VLPRPENGGGDNLLLFFLATLPRTTDGVGKKARCRGRRTAAERGALPRTTNGGGKKAANSSALMPRIA